MIIDKIINSIIDIEGGYTNDPRDSGGETKYGITLATAREYGYTGPMKDLPRCTAYSIYKAMYCYSVKAEQLAALSEAVAAEVVDTGVNAGVKIAIEFLQRALNVLNSGSTLFPDIEVDGSIGPATLNALKRYLATRDVQILLKALNVLQGAYYIELAERREKDEKFIYGWLKNRISL